MKKFKFIKWLETEDDPEHPSMGPIIRSLKMSGMWKSEKKFCKANLIQCFAISVLLTELIELWLLKSDLPEALKNLSTTTLSAIIVVKSGTFVLWQKDWKSVIDYVSALEINQRLRNNKEVNIITANYIKYSRRISHLYSCLTYVTVLDVMIAPLINYVTSSEYREMIRNGSVPYPEILSSWVPFDKSTGSGYVTLLVIQILMAAYGGVTVASYDSNAVVIMTFFTGQLRILKADCLRLFEETTNFDDTVKRIQECHLHHNALIK